jgi:hypothetical protein
VRFTALSKPEVMKGRDVLDILVKADKDANTITIEWVLTQPGPGLLPWSWNCNCIADVWRVSLATGCSLLT